MAIIQQHGNRNQFQKNLIMGVNAYAKSELPLIKNGMCYMLTLHWILEYLNANPKTANTANNVFDMMTANIAVLRQVAQNFSSYISNALNHQIDKLANDEIAFLNLIKEQSSDFVELLSRGTRNAQPYLPTFKIIPTPEIMLDISLTPQTEAYLVLFYFNSQGKRYGHAVGMIANAANDFRIYDPNAGVYTSTVLTDIFASILAVYTDDPYSIEVNLILIR
jgi:hypothetical protein